MDNLFTVWKMYHKIPGWLMVCATIGITEADLRELEEIDQIMIELRGERENGKDTKERIRELISEVDSVWGKARRKEYLNSLIGEVVKELNELQRDYEQSFNNDEAYGNRAILTYAIDDIEGTKRKYEAELKALNSNGKIISLFDKVQVAKERKFEEFLELKRGKALCPFHEDRNPSFSVKDEHGHCFGCGWSGDIIDFVMTSKEFAFSEAISFLT